jgi:uncharacterized membrane protein
LRRIILRTLLALIFYAVGIVHLRYTNAFLPIMPAWVPYSRDVIILTGICELAGATGLLVPKLRYLAGLMLALYAVCVFPANIKQAIDGGSIGGVHLTWWYHAPRLAFQPVIVWWALYAGGVMSWPFRKEARTSFFEKKEAKKLL